MLAVVAIKKLNILYKSTCTFATGVILPVRSLLINRRVAFVFFSSFSLSRSLLLFELLAVVC